MYFPTVDTILNLLTTGLFIFYLKKKLDENEEIKRSVFLNFDFFTNVLTHYLQENLCFYTDEDKQQFVECSTKINNFITTNTQLLPTQIQKMVQAIIQFVGVFQLQTVVEKEPTTDEVATETKEPPKPVIFEEKYKEEYKNAEETELDKERLEQLKNTILIENTPLGNVVMYYDSSRETFIYYSDSTMPYRYLEVVARKYVVMNRCKKLYVDMEKELKEAQEKLEKKQKEEQALKEQVEESKEKNEKEGSVAAPAKKNVFAKLKNYNRDNSLKTAGIPSDNKSVSKKVVPPTTDKNATSSKNEPLLLKENANRYSYEGKMVNFSFLKKVERKVVDKRYAMNFSDFKKMMFDKKKT